MKLLIMCEGPNELAVINLLLEKRSLKFTSDDLLGLVPYHARQIGKSGAVQAALNLYPGQVKVLRIGDVLNENFKIPAVYREKVLSVEKYCTKPELEMLLIIAENLTDQFEKVKSSRSPKNFAKDFIRCGKKNYDNSSQFYLDYFGNNTELLVASLREYKRIKGSHKKDELYLADLLR